MNAHDLTADGLPAIEIESGFDDRVRDGCGLLVAATLISAWIIGGTLLVNWLLPLGGSA